LEGGSLKVEAGSAYFHLQTSTFQLDKV